MVTGKPVLSLKGSMVFNIRGRIRVKYRGVSLLEEHLKNILDDITSIYYVKKAEINTLTENVLVIYDGKMEIEPEQIIESLDNIFEKYSIDAYKKLLEKNAQLASSEKNEGEMSTRQLLARLFVSGAMIVGTKILAPALNPVIMKNRPVLSKFTTVPAITSLMLTAPLFKTSWEGIKNEKRPNADFLTVSSIIASLLLGNSVSALTIIALSDIAEFMTAYTIEKTRNSIKNLLSIDQDFVWKVDEDGNTKKVNIDDLKRHDKVIIHTGEKISVDGNILSGEAIIDQSSITGEYMPVIRKNGDKVFAGGIIKNGNITVEAEKIGDETVISRIIDLVENSAAVKAPIQHYADRFSNYLVPLNFVLSGLIFAVTKNTTKALNMLVIDYSCGIKLSTATAFSASINTAVKKGVLIKGGAFIEQMSLTDTIVFDKTGTITEGRPRVTDIMMTSEISDEKELIKYACAAEETSSHPLASCVLDHAKLLGVKAFSHGEVVTTVARGSHTTVYGKTVRAGNLSFMNENGIHVPDSFIEKAKECTPIFISLDSKLLGLICTVDNPRRNIKRSINMLRSNGINEVIMLTGDIDSQAKRISKKVNTDTYLAELLPEDKANHILKLKSEGTGVIMVGDGINDAPALSYSNVGISLGSKSTDIAMETSDIVINSDDPMMIPEVLRMSNKTMDIVKQNFALVISINTIGLILGAASNISVFWSAVLHNMSTIFVVGNSCRLLFYNIGGE